MKNKYSYEYKNLTSQGRKLSIRNNIVYLGDKRAPVGYKWFDKNNNVTYRVSSDGTWQPILDNQGRQLKRGSRITWGKHKSFFEKDLHIEDIPEEDKKPFDKLFEQHLNTVEQRILDEENYFIPMYLPGVKIALPKNKGLFKNVNIPYNALDSLYKWSGDKESFINSLGLTRETSFMKFPSRRFNLKKDEYNLYNKRPEYNRILDPDRSFGYYPTDLMNNHHYYNNTPYSDETSALIKLGIIDGVLPFKDEGGSNFFPYSKNALTEEAQSRIGADMKYLKPRYHNENPVKDALYYLHNSNYGMSPVYVLETRNIGLQLFDDPGLSDWRLSRNIK